MVTPSSGTWVYPRTYGGTASSVVRTAKNSGLSPHIRGNGIAVAAIVGAVRSIPAHTGERSQSLAPSDYIEVYPRTYGGTKISHINEKLDEGLSPHIRGNGILKYPPLSALGSIPAHTGERHTTYRQRATKRVYPRTYGGTGSASDIDVRHSGLSPHIRGNGSRSRTRRAPPGSIPAHTGER